MHREQCINQLSQHKVHREKSNNRYKRTHLDQNVFNCALQYLLQSFLNENLYYSNFIKIAIFLIDGTIKSNDWNKN